jgi:hypothetical protein
MAKKVPALMQEQKELAENQTYSPPPTQDPAVLEFYITLLKKARDERNIARKEFDLNTFEADFERNRETLFSFLRPKVNNSDVRFNSGVAEKKIELVMNELLAMNFRPEVRAYDRQNRLLREMSADFTDLVRKTIDIAKEEDADIELFLDLLGQRAVFTEECLGKRQFSYSPKIGIPHLYAYKRRLSPIQVYLGDIYIPAYRFQEQPFLVIYDRKLYQEAALMFGDNPEWQYVKPGMGKHDEFIPFFKFRFSDLKNQEVEILTILARTANGIEKMRIINSVMMDKPGEVIDKVFYPMTMTTLKNIPDFAYGKPLTGSAKYLAGLKDESIRNAVRKFRQGIEPPSGVKDGKVYTRESFDPGAFTQGLTGDNFSRLVDHDGITSSEYQFLQMIDNEIEQFIGSPDLQSEAGGKKTATEILALQKLAIKQLGLSVLGVMRMKRDAAFLRVNSILTEYMKPIGERTIDRKKINEYQQFEIEDGRTPDGEPVKKYITFIERNLSNEELRNLREYEREEEKRTGKKVSYSFLNVKAMENFILDFKIEVTPESRDSSALDQVLFQDRLNQAMQIMQITGRKVSGDKLVEDFESAWKIKGMFEDESSIVPPGVMEGGSVEDKAKGMMKNLNTFQQMTGQLQGGAIGQAANGGV